MKRFLCLLMTSLLLLASLTAAQAADSYLSLNGFTFDINESGGAVIHEYDDRAIDVVIPNRLLGASVVKIDDYAFFGDTDIASVSFENASGLNAIGSCAFYGCTGLENITICSPLEELGFGAFQNCTGLKTLVIESGLTAIPEQAFYGDSALRSVSLSDSVECIGARAFGSCTGLTALAIPDSVTEIASNAFEGCDGLVIYCTKESYALQFATEKSMGYVITNPDTYMTGDVNLDGRVSISDVTCIQRYFAELDTLSNVQVMLADVDGDGLDISDATRIQCFLAEYDDPYHIGENFCFDEYELPFISA